ncbi:MAG TPA: hypothetical protein VJ785_05725 [Anaerolineales bacterium]|nr:hypothetical protein [Anaerolineales bacterium]
MKNELLRFISIFGLALLFVGCGPAVAPELTQTQEAVPSATDLAASPSATSDACSMPAIEAEVQKVHSHMREFDDASILASNLPREELSGPIADLQRIRREAEDEEIPTCLTNLKASQIQHMNTVIDTLLAFIGGADTVALEQSIAVAREQHDQYTLELARLLGLTVVPATVPVISTPAETATP